jgi:ribonuclease HI
MMNYALQFLFVTSNNITETRCSLLGSDSSKALGSRKVVVYSDSQLAVNEISGVYEAKDMKIKKYLGELHRMCVEFDKVEILHIPRT